jgi:signal transduction histidine kinase
MGAFAVVIALLVTGMAFAIGRMTTVSDRQLAYVRTEENEIAMVERLRSSGDLLVSLSHEYLLVGHPDVLDRVAVAETEFANVVKTLQHEQLSPRGEERIRDVDVAAAEFRRQLHALLDQRGSSSAMDPARQSLSDALLRLKEHKGDVIERVSTSAKQARAGLLLGVYALLGVLASLGLGVAWYFATKLERAYRSEAEALETTRKALMARDELMGIIAHDLRSPLAAIMMHAQLFDRVVTDPRALKQAASIHAIAARMAQLLNTLLDASTIEAGRFSITRTTFGVDDLIRETIDTFAPIAASKQVDLELECIDCGLVVDADRERMSQVLANLVGNAIKFTPRDGMVIVRVERTGDRVRFSIADSGPGIAPEHVPHIFDRHWKSETGGARGTGLGLFIAKTIIDAHGGSIEVETQVGRGTTFHVEVDLAPPALATVDVVADPQRAATATSSRSAASH